MPHPDLLDRFVKVELCSNYADPGFDVYWPAAFLPSKQYFFYIAETGFSAPVSGPEVARPDPSGRPYFVISDRQALEAQESINLSDDPELGDLFERPTSCADLELDEPADPDNSPAADPQVWSCEGRHPSGLISRQLSDPKTSPEDVDAIRQCILDDISVYDDLDDFDKQGLIASWYPTRPDPTVTIERLDVDSGLWLKQGHQPPGEGDGLTYARTNPVGENGDFVTHFKALPSYAPLLRATLVSAHSGRNAPSVIYLLAPFAGASGYTDYKKSFEENDYVRFGSSTFYFKTGAQDRNPDSPFYGTAPFGYQASFSSGYTTVGSVPDDALVLKADQITWNRDLVSKGILATVCDGTEDAMRVFRAEPAEVFNLVRMTWEDEHGTSGLYNHGNLTPKNDDPNQSNISWFVVPIDSKPPNGKPVFFTRGLFLNKGRQIRCEILPDNVGIKYGNIIPIDASRADGFDKSAGTYSEVLDEVATIDEAVKDIRKFASINDARQWFTRYGEDEDLLVVPFNWAPDNLSDVFGIASSTRSAQKDGIMPLRIKGASFILPAETEGQRSYYGYGVRYSGSRATPVEFLQDYKNGQNVIVPYVETDIPNRQFFPSVDTTNPAYVRHSGPVSIYDTYCYGFDTGSPRVNYFDDFGPGVGEPLREVTRGFNDFPRIGPTGSVQSVEDPNHIQPCDCPDQKLIFQCPEASADRLLSPLSVNVNAVPDSPGAFKYLYNCYKVEESQPDTPPGYSRSYQVLAPACLYEDCLECDCGLPEPCGEGFSWRLCGHFESSDSITAQDQREEAPLVWSRAEDVQSYLNRHGRSEIGDPTPEYPNGTRTFRYDPVPIKRVNRFCYYLDLNQAIDKRYFDAGIDLPSGVKVPVNFVEAPDIPSAATISSVNGQYGDCFECISCHTGCPCEGGDCDCVPPDCEPCEGEDCDCVGPNCDDCEGPDCGGGCFGPACDDGCSGDCDDGDDDGLNKSWQRWFKCNDEGEWVGTNLYFPCHLAGTRCAARGGHAVRFERQGGCYERQGPCVPRSSSPGGSYRGPCAERAKDCSCRDNCCENIDCEFGTDDPEDDVTITMSYSWSSCLYVFGDFIPSHASGVRYEGEGTMTGCGSFVGTFEVTGVLGAISFETQPESCGDYRPLDEPSTGTFEASYGELDGEPGWFLIIPGTGYVEFLPGGCSSGNLNFSSSDNFLAPEPSRIDTEINASVSVSGNDC